MSLSPGSRLGPYEILAPLGAGGMGEVYRARDPRLSREVAIKVLPASFSRDADRLRRFEQEARSASAPEPPQHHDDPRHRLVRLDALHRHGARRRKELAGADWLGRTAARAKRCSTSACRSPRASPRRTRRGSSTGT